MDILIIRPGAIGDTLMILPALNHLDRRIRVTYAGNRPGIDFLKGHAHRLYDMERSGWHTLFMADCDKGDLPVQRTGLVIAFFRDREGMISRNLEKIYPGVPIHVFPSSPPSDQEIHTAEYVAACFKGAGLEIDPQRVLEKAVSVATLSGGDGHSQRDSIVVHPGSGSAVKNYTHEFWRDILQDILSEADVRGLNLFILIGPAEEEIHAYLTMHRRSLKDKIICCPDSEGLTGFLHRASLYIGHDSGLTHLAAMLGTPTIALFKGTNPRQWRPLGPHVQVIRKTETFGACALDVISCLRHFLGEKIQGN